MRILPIALALSLTFCVRVQSKETSVARDTNSVRDADLERKIGQMILVGFRGFSVDDDAPIARDIRLGRVGGVILFDYDVTTKQFARNIQSPSQVKNLTSQLRKIARNAHVPRLFIAVDQEGGRVARLKESYGFPATVSAQTLGEMDNIPETARRAEDMARVLETAGFNLNFAPVVDLNVNPKSPAIGALGRSFGNDPEKVAQQAQAFLSMMSRHGVTGVLKHFPGHGSAQGDSHAGFVDVTQTWSAREQMPYQYLTKSGNVRMIMTAHIFNAQLDQDFPATLSRRTINGLLREGIGFKGVVISDDMQMGAITQNYGQEIAVKNAVNAGVDILLFGNNLIYDPDIAAKTIGIIKRGVADGSIPRRRIEESWRRIQKLKALFKSN